MLDVCGLHHIQRALIGCLVLALGLGGCVSLPPLPVPAPAERPPLSGLGEEQRQIPPTTYILGPGDVLRVSVYGLRNIHFLEIGQRLLLPERPE